MRTDARADVELERKSFQLFYEGDVKSLDDNLYEVENGNGKRYIVDMRE